MSCSNKFSFRLGLVRRQCWWWWWWWRGREICSFSDLLETTERVGIPILYLTAWTLTGHFSSRLLSIFSPNRLEDDCGSSRRTRLLRLCSYLQEKYKHMCRQERASIRQKRYRYAFRKALLHAASNNPDCAGQLIQDFGGACRSSSRYSHKCHFSQFC